MAKLVFCGACGKQIDTADTVCPHCRAPRTPGHRYKDRTAAGLLALFVGAFGVHRFYLGQWWGIFYLLFFWLTIPAIVAVIEAIVFFCMPQERWDEKYNGGVATASEGSRVTLAIVLGVVGIFGIAILGILAAVAIPAYADYTARSRVTVALGTANEAAKAIEAYVGQHSVLPNSLADAGFEPPLPESVESIELDESNGNIVVTMQGAPFRGTSFALSPTSDGSSEIRWQCGTIDMPERYLPQRCRSPRD